MDDIVWVPSKENIEKANITRFMRKHGIKDYETLISRSTDDIAWFWDAVVKDLGIEWYKSYEKIYDDSQGIQWTKWFVGGKINIVHNCLDKHMKSEKKNNIALIWENETGDTTRLTYEELFVAVNKCANGLKELGVKKGDRVGIYMPMVPEIVIGFLAVMKIGAISIPIFSGFGGYALASRLNVAGATVLLTADGSMRRGKTVEIKKEADKALDTVSSLQHVVVLKRHDIKVPWNPRSDVWWDDLIAHQSPVCETMSMDSEEYAMIIFSSGTTGKPKGTVHTHGGALAQISKELGYYFDVKGNDVFFWLTDMGWMMGPWMIIGVQTFGGSIVIFEGTPNYPNPDRLWELVEKHKITIFGISPTAIRMLMRYGADWVEKHDMNSLRLLGSTGEPWDNESWMWFFEIVGKKKLPIINISGGTEIVGCFLSPLPITPLKPCTLRGPGLGMDIDVFDEEGQPIREEMGHLVAKKPAPSMTRGFWNEPDRYLETYWSRWPNVWYHGDWAMIDEDGFWSLHGRSDDTIKVAGRRTGPAEIEAALIEHPGVSEAATIGVPDEIKGEDLVCFVVLQPGFEPGNELKQELKKQVVKIMGKTLKPRDIKFVKELPKTRSAKIVRGIIKATFLGDKIPDVSSVENIQAIDDIKHAK